jgi:cytochrome P450
MQSEIRDIQKPSTVSGLPLLGNVFSFRSDQVEALYSAWKQAGDVFDYNIGPRTIRVISSPEMAEEILIAQKHIFQRLREVQGGTVLAYILGKSILTIDGEPWLVRRRMMQPIFHRQRIQAMANTMVEAGERMFNRWESHPESEPFDLLAEMKLTTLDIINQTMFSTDVLPEIDRIGSIVEVGLHYVVNRIQSFVQVPENWPTPNNVRFHQSLASLDEYLYRIIRMRRESDEHPEDLLDMLLSARDDDTGKGMNDEQIRNEVATIYGAGHETTAVALSWAWYALNQNPVALKKLQDEVDRVLQGRNPTVRDLANLPYTKAVFDETLRAYPPVPLTVRVAEMDTRVGDYDYTQGTVAAINIYNIHFHPD